MALSKSSPETDWSSTGVLKRVVVILLPKVGIVFELRTFRRRFIYKLLESCCFTSVGKNRVQGVAHHR